MNRTLIFAFFVPYIAMIIGLYFFHNAWIAFILYHFLILIIMVYTRNLQHLKSLFKGGNALIIFLAVLFGIGGGALIYFLNPIIGLEKYAPSVLTSLGLSGTSWLIFVFYHGFVSTLFEESYWRGFLGSKKKGVVWSDIMFAAYHILVLILFLAWYWSLLSFIILLLAAWFWRQLARRYKGLLIPMLSHMAADVSIIFTVYLLTL